MCGIYLYIILCENFRRDIRTAFSRRGVSLGVLFISFLLCKNEQCVGRRLGRCSLGRPRPGKIVIRKRRYTLYIIYIVVAVVQDSGSGSPARFVFAKPFTRAPVLGSARNRSRCVTRHLQMSWRHLSAGKQNLSLQNRYIGERKKNKRKKGFLNYMYIIYISGHCTRIIFHGSLLCMYVCIRRRVGTGCCFLTCGGASEERVCAIFRVPIYIYESASAFSNIYTADVF